MADLRGVPAVGDRLPSEEATLSDLSRTRRFEQLVLPHLDGAYNLARWLVRGPDDAEDVVQDAVLRAYRFFDSCRPETVRAWFLRIVRHACYDWLGARRAMATTGFADLDADDADGAAFTADVFRGPSEDPETILAKAEDKELINALIAALPAEYREVIVLRELEELSYKEIAEIANIPPGTVMSRLSRARTLLQREWTKRNDC